MAKIIDGKIISKNLNERTKLEVEKLNQAGITVSLAVIIVGDDPASRIYVNSKKRACEQLGIVSYEYSVSKNSSQQDLMKLINELNSRKDITGILCQMPLPEGFDNDEVIQAILPDKDVDCFNPSNLGKLVMGSGKLMPCTPCGIMEMLSYEGIDVDGKNCVVIGRSNIVGKPMSALLLNKSGTVTVCHSHTKDLAEITSKADILVAAIGKPNFVTEDMVKPGAVVIDVGINRQEGTKKLYGDVDFESVCEKAAAITPVPGGVGPMTIAELMSNTVTAAKLQNNIL